MKFKEDYFNLYLKEAPLPLAIERYFECEILSQKDFTRPILDIGCGEGMFAKILFDEKIDVGIDPNQRELQRAVEYGAYEELINCYGDDIPKESEVFNTIFSNSVLEHIPEINKVLKEANRLLSKSGKMYITVPTNLFDHYSMIFQILSLLGFTKIAERFRGFFNKFWAHHHYYDQKGWVELFKRNGFSVIEIREYANKSICLLDDFLAPFSFVPFLTKKRSNRWFLFPKFRFWVAKVLGAVFSPFIKYLSKDADTLTKKQKGGLIFFELEKLK
jgi:SAM-dependent methyltransferase